MKRRFVYNIDVMGSCNLRCPSCPAGNSLEVDNPRGAMKPELLAAIMDKASAETEIEGVGLFNWTEPLLHYDIAKLVALVQSYGVPCRLSSNLNVFKNVESVMEQAPASLRVSVSGFSQDNYRLTHAGGDVEKVKANMIELAAIKERLGVDTRLEVVYHRYLGNLDDEVRFRRFAADLGYEFNPNWAFFMPLEKMLACLSPEESSVALTESDREIVERLALPIREASEMAVRYRDRGCVLQEEQMTIDFRGEVMLCCAVYDAAAYGLGGFLEMSVEEIQEKKRAHSMCSICMRHGLHVYSVYGAPEFDGMALKRVLEYYESGAGLSLPTVRQRSRLVKTLMRVLPLPLLKRMRAMMD